MVVGGVKHMANQEHLDILNQGVDVWNKWRDETFFGEPQLKGVNLSGVNLRSVNLSESELSKANFRQALLDKAELWGANLTEADFSFADLKGAELEGAILVNTNFSEANLSETDFTACSHDIITGTITKLFTNTTDFTGTLFHRANLSGADLSEADLTKVDLRYANLDNAQLRCTNLSGVDLEGVKLSDATLVNANLTGANLDGADLRRANLTGADLNHANFRGAFLNDADLSGTYLCETNFSGANMVGCRIYGIAAWDVRLEGAKQENLIITPYNSPTITVDNLEVAQFIYLLLNNQKIRAVIDTITSKMVLILGRFTHSRKVILDAIREELRKRNYTPVLFDFEKPSNRDLTETVSTLAHLARFIIVDLTDPRAAGGSTEPG